MPFVAMVLCHCSRAHDCLSRVLGASQVGNLGDRCHGGAAHSHSRAPPWLRWPPNRLRPLSSRVRCVRGGSGSCPAPGPCRRPHCSAGHNCPTARSPAAPDAPVAGAGAPAPPATRSMRARRIRFLPGSRTLSKAALFSRTQLPDGPFALPVAIVATTPPVARVPATTESTSFFLRLIVRFLDIGTPRSDGRCPTPRPAYGSTSRTSSVLSPPHKTAPEEVWSVAGGHGTGLGEPGLCSKKQVNTLMAMQSTCVPHSPRPAGSGGGETATGTLKVQLNRP